MLGRLKLGTKISLITGLVVFLAFALTTWTLSTASAALSRQQSFDLAQSMAGEYASRVDAMLEVAIDAARTLAHTFEAMKSAGLTDRRLGNEVLRRVLEDNPEFVGVWTCWEPNGFDNADQSYVNRAGHDNTGRYIPYWNRDGVSIRLDPLLGYETEGEGDYYILAKRANEEVITPPYPYQIGGAEVLITSLVVPVRHQGAFVGVCGVDITLETIQALISHIRPHGSGFAALITHEGRYAAHPDSGQLNRDIGLLPADEQIKAAVGANKSLRLSRTLAGSEYYTTVVPLAVGRTKTAWGFLVNVPIEAVLAPSRQVRNTILMIGALALVAVLVVLPPVYRRLITAPVSRVTGVAQEIAAGDLVQAHRALASFDARTRRRKDEIGRLVDAFDTMVRNLSSLANQVQASALHVDFSSTEISSGSRQLEASSHQQAASAREVTATARLISDTSDELVTTMDSVAKDLASAVTQTELGRDALRGLQAAMAQLMDATVSISSKLNVISARANRISDVMTTMNKISDRTNVLALNAAIEAEKAGEYGRGFSVVSREISHLNDQTAVATEDISTVIGEMQSSVSAGLMEMEKFAQGVRHSTEEVRRIGAQLTALIDKVQGLEPEFKSITGGMHQQSQGAQQISEAISQLSIAADETQRSLIEFKQATESLNTATSELQTEAARFKALSDTSVLPKELG